MIKQALEYLIGLATPATLEVDGKPYSTTNLAPVMDRWPAALEVSTLSALVKYITEDADHLAPRKYTIHVESPSCVRLYTTSHTPHMQRNCLVVATPILPSIRFDTYMSGEDMVVMMQSKFVRNEGDWDKVAAVAGNVSDGVARDYADDGVSQSVTIRTGMAMKGDVVVPNPVMLAPFRTFQEIYSQPASPFLFRARAGSEKEKPTFALFEADGGAWQVKAMESIRMRLDRLVFEALGLEEGSNVMSFDHGNRVVIL